MLDPLRSLESRFIFVDQFQMQITHRAAVISHRYRRRLFVSDCRKHHVNGGVYHLFPALTVFKNLDLFRDFLRNPQEFVPNLPVASKQLFRVEMKVLANMATYYRPTTDLLYG